MTKFEPDWQKKSLALQKIRDITSLMAVKVRQPGDPETGSIIVAVDSSLSSRHSLEEAIRLADAAGCSVYAVHYIYSEEMEVFNRWFPEQQRALIDGRKTRLLHWLEEFELDTSKVSIHVQVGHPITAMMTLVETIHPRMVVIGMHGNHLASNGHSAEYLARACVRSVPTAILLVRDYKKGPFRKIVVGIDFSETSRKALREAAMIAQIEQSALAAVQVFAPDWELFGDRNTMERQVGAYTDEARQRFANWSKEALIPFGEPSIDFEVVEDISHPDGIINYASQAEADLIVVGLSGQSPIHFFYPGSTAEKVLTLADCSVLAIHPSGPDILNRD